MFIEKQCTHKFHGRTRVWSIDVTRVTVGLKLKNRKYRIAVWAKPRATIHSWLYTSQTMWRMRMKRKRENKEKKIHNKYTECNTKTRAKCKSHTITHWKGSQNNNFTMEYINEYVCKEWKAHSKRRDRRSEYKTSIDRTYIFQTILCRKLNNNNQLLRALNDSLNLLMYSEFVVCVWDMWIV